jgi:perosamine synthetase
MIPYTRPSISETEIEYCIDAVTNGWGERCYEYIGRFEEAFRTYIGVEYAHATSSCTGALVLALRSLGVSPNDEVIVADLNWVAAASAVKTLGATPICVDVEIDSWCISPAAVRSAINKATKAIIVTHLYGNVASISALVELSKEFGLPLIEDAAEALGSEYLDGKLGTFGDIGVFSFHGTKTMTTGEGGMLVTNNAELYEKAIMLNNHGRSSRTHKSFWSEDWGYKYKISNVQAAIGLGQVERLPHLVERKREIFNSYKSILENSGLRLNAERAGEKNSYWMPTIIFDNPHNIDLRSPALKSFSAKGIDARPVFWKLSDFEFISNATENVNASMLSKSGINLPSFHDIQDSEIQQVAEIALAVNEELSALS